MTILRQILSPKMRGALRHVLTAVGPILATHGVTSEAYWATIVGLLMAALGFYDSWTAPEKKP